MRLTHKEASLTLVFCARRSPMLWNVDSSGVTCLTETILSLHARFASFETRPPRDRAGLLVCVVNPDKELEIRKRQRKEDSDAEERCSRDSAAGQKKEKGRA